MVVFDKSFDYFFSRIIILLIGNLVALLIGFFAILILYGANAIFTIFLIAVLGGTLFSECILMTMFYLNESLKMEREAFKSKDGEGKNEK